jgi:hypothetical protein
VQHFMQLSGGAAFLCPCMALCIWPDAISQWVPTASVLEICANLGKSVMETLEIRQGFREVNMSCTQVFEWHSRFRADRKRGDR